MSKNITREILAQRAPSFLPLKDLWKKDWYHNFDFQNDEVFKQNRLYNTISSPVLHQDAMDNLETQPWAIALDVHMCFH